MSVGEVAAAFDAVCADLADEVSRLRVLADRVERIHHSVTGLIGSSTDPRAREAVRGYAEATHRLREAAQHLTACATATAAYRSIITGAGPGPAGHGDAGAGTEPAGHGDVGQPAPVSSGAESERQPPSASTQPFVPRPAWRDRHGNLTDGTYRVNSIANCRHSPGTAPPGRSVFLPEIDIDQITLEAAQRADHHGLWDDEKAKVSFPADVGIHGRTGRRTRVVNVYRRRSSTIHAAPGSPRD